VSDKTKTLVKVKSGIRAGVPNANGDVYSKEMLERMEEQVPERIKSRRLPGQLGSGPPTPDSISHIVRSVGLDAEGRLVCEIEVLDTPNGRVLKKLMRSGATTVAHLYGTGVVNAEGVVQEMTLESVNLALEDD